MTSLQPISSSPLSQPAPGGNLQAKTVYDALMHGGSISSSEEAVEFLNRQLTLTEAVSCDLPPSSDSLDAWIEQGVTKVAEQYAAYLEERHAGAPRRYFSSRSHAMYFIQQVAPTKLVDGAWLYGLLPHWGDYRYHGLIRTYLEELGDGDPALNHVSLYRKLLADLDCDSLQGLDDVRYLQGAIQLALGYEGAQFIPEVIGYNLGYEQLPLHLLITSFELNELGIDPYYFTLHVTIDNASTGHARKAAQSVLALLPMGEERDAFYRRVMQGYKLNELGTGSTDVIRSFDLEGEVIAMLERKRTFGQHMHSDYCKLDGKTVNEWLAKPDQIPAFLEVLQKRQWIRRNEDPANSRFWQLIEGAGAPMFGVFSGYEKQLLRDWIAGTWDTDETDGGTRKAARQAFRNQFRATGETRQVTADDQLRIDESDPDLQRLNQLLSEHSATEKMTVLQPFMSPARHPTPAGLMATREFVKTMAERMAGLQS
jgi:hypothetical protein